MKPIEQWTGLRRKVVRLLALFAAFAVVTAAATIYGLQWHINTAFADFELMMGQTVRVDRLQAALKTQVLGLRAVVEGRTDAVDEYFAARDEFASNLRQVSAYALEGTSELPWTAIIRTAAELEAESDRCIARVREGKIAEAASVLTDEIEGEIVAAMYVQLARTRSTLDGDRNQAAQTLGAISSEMLLLTIVVSVLAAALVVGGATLVHRWLVVPINALKEATEHYARGDLGYRVTPSAHDELGALGVALNEMASSLAGAKGDLQASEEKYRLLFSNLRDAVVLCDCESHIVEFHDSDTELLGVEGSEHLGRRVLDVWPEWRAANADWPAIIAAAVTEGRRFRAVDVLCATDGYDDRVRHVDFLVYRIQHGDTKLAAIVVRDVTERQQLQRKLRQAETMEAVGTLAGGLAHDFNNLLAGIIGSLSLLAAETVDPDRAERLRGVIRTCWQAAGLSRRLLNFAGSAHGEAQVFCINEAVTVITDSLDPSFIEGVDLRLDLHEQLFVRMDQDQFTQIVLNLLRNARDAMPDGGVISVTVREELGSDPDDTRRERAFAVVKIRDDGVGMSSEVRNRVFEPFFSTKSRSSRRGRGMGMAIVYAAVRGGGGFIKIESEQGVGTTMRVCLPLVEAPSRPHDAAPMSQETPVDFVLVVEEDDVMREVGVRALQATGYTVIAADGVHDAMSRIASVGHNRIRLAVVDRHLSDGAALDVVDRLLELGTEVRIIFTSTGDDLIVPAHIQPYVAGHLQKPFALDAFSKVICSAWLASGAGSVELPSGVISDPDQL